MSLCYKCEREIERPNIAGVLIFALIIAGILGALFIYYQQSKTAHVMRSLDFHLYEDYDTGREYVVINRDDYNLLKHFENRTVVADEQHIPVS